MDIQTQQLAPLSRHPWAMLPEKLDEIVDLLHASVGGIDFPYRAEQPTSPTKMKTVAVLPLVGILGQRPDLFMKLFGGTSTESFAADLRGLVADPAVSAIVVTVDSPGGGVFGTPELAQTIFSARGRKPIVAVANSVAASAAYWIASAADEMIVTPAGQVGAIGIYALHRDLSVADARVGVKNTFIKAGRLKTVGNPHEPLSQDAKTYLQKNVDRYYAMFTGAVAKHRGVSVNQVRNGFGEGGMVGAQDAVQMGMADHVATLDETIVRMITSAGRSATLAASDQRRRRAYQSNRVSPASRTPMSPEDEFRMRRLWLS